MRKNLLRAALINAHEISVVYLPNYANIEDIDFFLVANNRKILLKKEVNSRQAIPEIKLKSDKAIELGFEYYVETSDEESIVLDLEEYVLTEEFDELYSYDGNDLGNQYSKEETTFKVWSPLASAVALKIEIKHDKFTFYDMKRGDKGVFSLTLNGDFENRKYSYITYISGKINEIKDPYSKATSLNSHYSAVVDLSKVEQLNNIKPQTEIKNYNDAIIYELNIRDFTEKSNVKHKGTYLGMIEKIPYLKRLGITHVQLLPVLDFDNVDDIKKDTYNWGYDPIGFFALEGSYSSHPQKPLARMLEFKTLVNELHKNDIRVILDVVYNHLYDYKKSDFQKNVPYYYFRTYRNKMCNASGCGNDLATERRMVRKIILDSIKFLMETYDVDGFRFDLLGLIDIDTTNKIISLAKSIKKDVMLYGEGWHMGTNLPDDKKSSMLNADKMPGMGFFNDTFRDLIKGSTFSNDPGYVSGNLDYKNQVEQVMSGSVLNGKFNDVNQSINYVECHDNQTLFDKLYAIDNDEELALKHLKLANAITILSLGVPFIHMGQEIGLSKFALDNTYNIKNVNNMDWSLVEKRKEYVNYVADLIRFRKKLNIFKMSNKDEILKTLDFFQLENGVLTIAIRNEKYLMGHKKALYVINPTNSQKVVEFDEYFRLVLGSAGYDENGEVIVKYYMAPPSSLILFILE